MPLDKIILQEEPNWYFKVIGMLQHNYAFIHEKPDGSTVVYFLHERGSNLEGFFPSETAEIYSPDKKEYPNIVDSLEFPNLQSAQYALERNFFHLIAERGKDFDLDSRPRGKVFIDIRKHESGIYSKQDKYWIK
jgi:hypothetical protein